MLFLMKEEVRREELKLALSRGDHKHLDLLEVIRNQGLRIITPKLNGINSQ